MNISKCKRYFISLVIIASCLNSYAAVVSDNDGAAFITKGELDALKNDFEKQISNYNESLDTKIDGAIANYLDSLNKKESQISTICYVSDGIMSPRSGYSDLYWNEGLLNLKLKINLYNPLAATETSGNALYVGGKIDGKTPTEFKELSVRNVDYTNGFAEWTGWLDTIQNIDGAVWDYEYGHFSDMASPTNYLYPYKGFYRLSNIDLSNVNDKASCFAYSNEVSGSTGGYDFIPLEFKAMDVKWERTIKNTKYSSIICTPISVPCSRFSNIDSIRDWCNDTKNDDVAHPHTVLSNMNMLFSTSTMTHVHHTSFTDRTSIQDEFSFSYGTYTDDTDMSCTRVLPYFGFVSTINDYNKLWTSKYDNYISDMESYDPTIDYYTDAAGIKHLYLTAGAPIAFATQGKTISISVDFADKTKNYDLWIKTTAFKKSVLPQNDADCMAIGDIKNEGVTASAGTVAKSISIKNGHGVVSFEMPDDGYVFFKWSLAGNGGAGGGTFMPPSTVSVY